MADHPRTALALDARALALRARRPPPGLGQHTDRGSHYTATTYRAALAARGATVSLRRAGACLDRALAESCFATRKAESSARQTWPTRAATRLAIFAWREVWANRRRRHAALDS